MKALVLGCGSIGSRHATNLADHGIEVMLHDPDGSRAAEVARRMGGTVVAAGETADAELVVVATPSANHVDDLAWALDHGMHVFVEKPLAATRVELERARVLAGAVRSQVVMVGCNMRFTDGFRCLARSLPRVGQVLSVQATFGWYLPSWRPGQDYREGYSAHRAMGGGVILDAIHEIDYVIALAGPVHSTLARWVNTGSLEIDTEDLAEIVMSHGERVISSIHLDYLQRTYTRACRVAGTEGTLTWDYAAHRVDLVADGLGEALMTGADREPNAMYVAELRSFLDAVATGAATPNDLASALATTEVAITALEEGGM